MHFSIDKDLCDYLGPNFIVQYSGRVVSTPTSRLKRSGFQTCQLCGMFLMLAWVFHWAPIHRLVRVISVSDHVIVW